MRTEPHRHRSHAGGWASPARGAHKHWPSAHAPNRPERLGQTAVFGKSGPRDECDEIQSQASSRTFAPGFAERLHEELKSIASRLRARARYDERTWAVVEGLDADYIVVVAHHPSGHQGFRLPLDLFSTPPRPGTRVSIVLSSEPTHALERQHEDHQAWNLSHATPEEAPIADTTLDRAYDELDALLAKRHVKGPDPEIEKRIEEAWAHLDALQEDLCAVVHKELDASVQLPPDELERMLVEIRSRLDDEEDT